MKKMFSLALALIMALALTVPAFAAETKTITVNNAVDGQTYNAYQVFGVTNSGENYAYSIDKGSAFWETVEAYAADNVGTSFTLTEIAGSTLVVVTPDVDENNVAKLDAAAFAAALSADATKPVAAGTEIASGTTVTIDVTEFGDGYYFLDSSLGSLCALNTAVDAAVVYEKNSVPTITKWVDEDDDSDANGQWLKAADADFAQTVNFKLVVNTGTNEWYKNEDVNDTEEDPIASKNGVDGDYVIEDVLPSGMTYVADTARIDTWTVGTDYTVAYSGDKLTITLAAAKVADLGQNANIEIKYSATLDADATVDADDTDALEGNLNTVTLTYKGETSTDSATVYTWNIPVLKYTLEASGKEDDPDTKDVDESKVETPLANATFTLSKSEDGSKPLTFTKVAGEETYKYDPQGIVTEITTTATGAFDLIGLDSATYYLTETAAPDGYNKLAKSIKVEIITTVDENGNITATSLEADDVVTSIVKVENLSGTVLPSTGGMGTTIFYVVGGVLMAGAAILLVTKKKLANQE